MKMKKPTVEQFMSVLFQPDEHTCYSKTQRGISVYPVKQVPEKIEFFCINALDGSKDRCPSREFHDENIPRRCDGNVVSFRNFLIEMDEMPLDKQLSYVLQRIPVSTITYSGGKSFHFIISLETSLNHINEYRAVADMLLTKLDKSDQSCKNPSRLSRFPDAVRHGGKRQRLLYVGNRIPNQTIIDLIGKKSRKKGKKKVRREIKGSGDSNPAEMVKKIVADPNRFAREWGSRNKLMHVLGQRLLDIGMDESQRREIVHDVYDKLEDKTDFTMREVYSAARVGGFSS